jgi:hypothetical protein
MLRKTIIALIGAASLGFALAGISPAAQAGSWHGAEYGHHGDGHRHYGSYRRHHGYGHGYEHAPRRWARLWHRRHHYAWGSPGHFPPHRHLYSRPVPLRPY